LCRYSISLYAQASLDQNCNPPDLYWIVRIIGVSHLTRPRNITLWLTGLEALSSMWNIYTPTDLSVAFLTQLPFNRSSSLLWEAALEDSVQGCTLLSREHNWHKGVNNLLWPCPIFSTFTHCILTELKTNDLCAYNHMEEF
jgi:hypothetical protein